MNAGANGAETKDVLIEATGIDRAARKADTKAAVKSGKTQPAGDDPHAGSGWSASGP